MTEKRNPSDQALAISAVREAGCTCALAKDGVVRTSRLTGIRPLLCWLREETPFSGAFVADKILGRAAALLLIYGSTAQGGAPVKGVHGEVLSLGAQQVFDQYGIPCTCGQLTESIINRRGDGICPMEQAVEDTNDPRQAYRLLQQTAQRLSKERE